MGMIFLSCAEMKTNEVTVKPLTEGDYCDWYKYWQAYLSFYKTSLTEEVTQATWAKILDSNVPIYGFGAFDRTNLVGIAHVVLHPNTWNTTDCCYLEDLYVDGAARGLGIGRALIEKVYQFAEVHNCNRVYWVTDTDNENARYLYDKLARETDVVQYRKDLPL